VTEQVVELLRRGGAIIDLIVPEAIPWDLGALRPEHDLYVLKAKSPLTLSAVEALETMGAVAVNTSQASRWAKNKVLHSVLLARTGVPLPPSWAAASMDALAALVPRDDGAVLVKPPAGSMAANIHRLTAADELDGTAGEVVRRQVVDERGFLRPVLVQRELATDGGELKVYAVGDWVAATARPPEVQTAAETYGRPTSVPDAVREATLACGAALGLELYGVDVMRAGDQFWVVDVNAFPSYKGIEEAPRRIADHLLRRARGA
jgi:ribosomal protein S6--L-glutamate ligase